MAFRTNAVCVLLVLVFGGVCNAFPKWFSKWGHADDSQEVHHLTPHDPVQIQLNEQSQQSLWAPMKNLTWHYPLAPVMPTQADVPLEMIQSVRAQSVAADCGESLVHVEVKQDLFGMGGSVNPSDLTLGECGPIGEDPVVQVFVFESELHLCGSVFTMTEDEMIYTFTLHYDPQSVAGAPVVRHSGTAINIECHYSRKHNVSSNALMPAWIPYTATVQAEEKLVFSLRLMTDDWQYERPSNQYYLGDHINIEASVMQYNHVPLRVFVDSCVASAAPDRNATTAVYPFIQNYGCLVDAKLTGSTSLFMPRVQDDKLQFQLETFLFQQQTSGLIYFTCFLNAVPASAPTDAEHKACSYTANGWTAVDQGQVCDCCDASCGPVTGGSTGPQWQGDASLGPVSVKELFTQH